MPKLKAEKVKLSDPKLKALKPADKGKRYEILDTGMPGLRVRINDKRKRTFMIRDRRLNKGARLSIGEYPVLSLEEARKKAGKWLALIGRGADPRDEDRRQRIEQQRKRANSFRAVAEDFIRLQVIGPKPEKPKQRKGVEVKRDIEGEFLTRDWAGRPITEITAHDIVAVLDEAVARDAPYQAHNLLGHIRRLFNWAIARGVYGIDRSPCDRMKPKDVIGAKALRTRVLTDPELQAFWQATGETPYPYGPLFRMLLLTGQRKSEVAEAQWPEFDLNNKLWIIPAGRMKADAPHVVPLTDDVIAILETLPEFKKGDHLFSTTFGAKAVNGFSKAKAALDKAMLEHLRKENSKVKLAPFVIHDIRRTMRTGLSALPVSDLVRELVIAHTKPGLHKVYDQHTYEAEKRHALELWAGRMRSIVNPLPVNVVNISNVNALRA